MKFNRGAACAILVLALSACNSDDANFSAGVADMSKVRDAHYRLAFREHVDGRATDKIYSIESSQFWVPAENGGYYGDFSVWLSKLDPSANDGKAFQLNLNKSSALGIKTHEFDGWRPSFNVRFSLDSVEDGRTYRCSSDRRDPSCSFELWFSADRLVNDLGESEYKTLFDLSRDRMYCDLRISTGGVALTYRKGEYSNGDKYETAYPTDNLKQYFVVGYTCHDSSTYKVVARGSYLQGVDKPFDAAP